VGLFLDLVSLQNESWMIFVKVTSERAECSRQLLTWTKQRY